MANDTGAIRLNAASRGSLSTRLSGAAYDRSRLCPSIVHIGVGGFHRAHLATYVHELCGQGRTDWSIVGAGVLASDVAMAEALAAQDHLYCLITRGPDRSDVEIIASIVDYVLATPTSDVLQARIADPDTQIVSLTITEAGYPVDDATGTYQADAASAGARSAFGVLAAALDRRRHEGGGPLTVMSCDNIMANGAAARASTLGEAARIGGDLERWIADSVSFPNSMVDRITPATTDTDRQWLREHVGVIDRWPVVTEPFRQWVIEDRFAGARLPLEDLDVIVTSDVEPYELMKLRLLNAGHSSLAYLAALQDFESVDGAVSEPSLRLFLRTFFDHEARPVLPPVSAVDLDEYTASLLERFSNPQIGDQIARLCLDGSAKFPKFLLPTVRAQLDRGGSVALSALALAGWCQYLCGTTSTGRPIERSADPLLAQAVDHAQRSQDDPRAFLAFTEVFGTDLASSAPFADAFERALGRLRSAGVPSAIAATIEEVRPSDDRASR